MALHLESAAIARLGDVLSGVKNRAEHFKLGQFDLIWARNYRERARSRILAVRMTTADHEILKSQAHPWKSFPEIPVVGLTGIPPLSVERSPEHHLRALDGTVEIVARRTVRTRQSCWHAGR
jgi:hypothetical protein